VGGNLEQLALGVGDDGDERQADILGLHVEGKRVGDGLGLASLDGQVVLDGREVADDALVGGGVGGELLGGGQDARHEGNADGAVLLVGHLDECLGRAAVDEPDAEDIGIRERRLDVGSELRGRRVRLAGIGIGISLYVACAHTARRQQKVSSHLPQVIIDGEGHIRRRHTRNCETQSGTAGEEGSRGEGRAHAARRAARAMHTRQGARPRLCDAERRNARAVQRT